MGRIPGVRRLRRSLRDASLSYALRSQLGTTASSEQVFKDIYQNNRWEGTASISGTGSGLDRTGVIARELPPLLRELGVRTMLDIPCGDFNWMKNVDLTGISYTGADIVQELIRADSARYGGWAQFRCLDLVSDPLPLHDLVFCRDCLVHLSYVEIFRALRNVCASGATYLLTTTFPCRTENWDIGTGGWRPLNLQRPPLSLPPPLRLINEGCTDGGGAYADKSLGLWHVVHIQRALRPHPLGRLLSLCVASRPVSASE